MNLSDHTTITAGHPFRSRIPEQTGAGTVVVQMKDTTAFGDIRWESAIETRPISRSPQWLAVGDILLAARGNRNYAVLVANLPQKHRALAAPHWYVIRPNTDNLLPEFLCWQLNRKPAQDWFRRESAGSVTKNLTRESLNRLRIAIPPLQEQRRIAAMAATARRERETLEQLVANTEQFSDGLARRLLNTHTIGIKK